VMLDRIEFLEARLAHVQKRLRDGSGPARDDKDKDASALCTGTADHH